MLTEFITHLEQVHNRRCVHISRIKASHGWSLRSLFLSALGLDVNLSIVIIILSRIFGNRPDFLQDPSERSPCVFLSI